MTKEKPRKVKTEKAEEKLIPWQIVFIIAAMASFFIAFTLWGGWKKGNYERLLVVTMSALSSIVLLGIEIIITENFSKIFRENRIAMIASFSPAIVALAAIGVVSTAIALAATEIEAGKIPPLVLATVAILVFAVPTGSHVFGEKLAKGLGLTRKETTLYLVCEAAIIFITINTVLFWTDPTLFR